MRIAVVSNNMQRTGKTALSIMLGNIFPNASNRESVYCTNKSLSEVLNYMSFVDEDVILEKGINVVTALAVTGSITKEDLIDYAYRPMNTKLLAFDIFSETLPYDEANHNFLSVMSKLEPRCIVMDITGDITSKEIKPLIDSADVVLYVVNPDFRDLNQAKKYFDSLSDEERLKLKFVCNKYNSYGLSKKAISSFLKLRPNSIFWVPYSFNLERVMLEKRMCKFNQLIVEGRDGCVEMRAPLREILDYVYSSKDSKGKKVIKEVSAWEL